MKYILPLPPSINNTYAVDRHAYRPLYKKQTVKDWEREAGWEIKRQHPGLFFKGSVAVTIVWYYKMNRDIDAGLKVLLDLFQTVHVYENDKQVRRIKGIDIYEDRRSPRVEIDIEKFTGGSPDPSSSIGHS